MRTPHLLVPVVTLLLFACFAATVHAFPLQNERPGNVLTMIMGGCGKQQSWQAGCGSAHVNACLCLPLLETSRSQGVADFSSLAVREGQNPIHDPVTYSTNCHVLCCAAGRPLRRHLLGGRQGSLAGWSE